ncbi:MAG: DUF2135 domain-containing protein [Azoarcus sp.]|jgi:uncharacterized protein YfaP (DUF2135 family)|nr:DUF2135 domain-containing protein [Azoarcus sp.]
MNTRQNEINACFFRRNAALLIPALALALLPVPALAELDAPIAGWRLGNPDTPFSQEVHYPAVRPGIDADTPESAQIRGRVRAYAKSADTATLVVNGNAMPVRLEAGGAFARPYSFGAGGNSVEVISGEERSRVQFHQSANGQSVSRLRVLLSWDTGGTDLDLHVVTPNGQHAWYGQRAINGGAIDIDVTDGYGPEIFASAAPEKGLYQIYVNFYGSGRELLTIARLSIITDESTPHEKRQEFTVPMRFPGELVLMRQFMY